jgi:hypothetical protein
MRGLGRGPDSRGGRDWLEGSSRCIGVIGSVVEEALGVGVGMVSSQSEVKVKSK